MKAIPRLLLMGKLPKGNHHVTPRYEPHGTIPNMLYVSIPQSFIDSMFGLPDITIFAVGIVVVIVIAALALLGTDIQGA